MKKAEDFFLFVASLGIAVLVWLQVETQTEGPKKRILNNVEVRRINTPPGLIAISPPSTVRVEVSGRAAEVDRLDDRSITAYVDLKGAKAVAFDAPVHIDKPVDSAIDFKASDDNKYVRIQLDSLVSQPVSVSLQTLGFPPTGYKFQGAAVSPTTVTVSGPSTTMAAISKVRAIIDLSDLRSSNPVDRPVEVLDKDNRVLPYLSADPSTVTITPAVVVAPAQRRLLVTPEWKGQPAFGYRVASVDIRPAQVMVDGNNEALAGLQTLDTSPVDISNAKGDLSVEILLKLPPGLKAEADTVTVTVHIVSTKGGG